MIEGASILVTGGTGTFAQAFAREVLANHRIKRLVLFSRDEVKQAELAQKLTDPRIRFFLGDIRDLSRLEMALRDIDYIIHAAALKRIEKCEYDPIEAVRTNVEGSKNIIEAALRTKVRRVVVLSTDKAVNPINLYGATKMCMERLFLAANNLAAGQCSFRVVRYGNIWFSRGSVGPIWQTIKSEGGTTVPISDPKVTRFFMTQRQAVGLVLSALEAKTVDSVVVPVLPAYRLGDLAKAMKMKTRRTKLQKFEKRHEELGGGQKSDKARRMSVTELRIALEEHGSDGELWRPIIQCPGYEISSHGRSRNIATERILKPLIRRDGYYRIAPSINGKNISLLIHRLVCEAFYGPPPSSKHHAAHWDGDKSNNYVLNLRWATALENHADMNRHGKRPRGSKRAGAKLTEDDVAKIRTRATNGEKSLAIIAAQQYGVSPGTIRRIISRKLWTHVT